MNKLTDRQQRFVDEYLVDANATQAAIKAGYSAKTAKVIGAQNLSKLNVKQAITEGQKAIQKRTQITAEEKRHVLWHIVQVNTQVINSPEEDAVPLRMINPQAATSAIQELNRMDGDLAAIKQDIQVTDDREAALNHARKVFEEHAVVKH
jgi:phage terminase small subunit